jgi:hypothetical protein
VSICGELAGNPMAAVLLLAMGYDVLSMNATSLPRVKSAPCARLPRSEARDAACRGAAPWIAPSRSRRGSRVSCVSATSSSWCPRRSNRALLGSLCSVNSSQPGTRPSKRCSAKSRLPSRVQSQRGAAAGAIGWRHNELRGELPRHVAVQTLFGQGDCLGGKPSILHAGDADPHASGASASLRVARKASRAAIDLWPGYVQRCVTETVDARFASGVAFAGGVP